jgi:hypothetical protein
MRNTAARSFPKDVENGIDADLLRRGGGSNRHPQRRDTVRSQEGVEVAMMRMRSTIAKTGLGEKGPRLAMFPRGRTAGALGKDGITSN